MQNPVKLSLIALLSLQASCATVVRGTTEPFRVITDPPGAIVSTTLETHQSKKARKVNPNLQARTYGCSPTPCEIELPRRSKFIAKIDMAGFQPVRATILSSASPKGKMAGASTVGALSAATAAEAVAAASTSIPAFSGLLTSMAISGGIVLGSPLVATDAVSGAMLNLYPNPVAVKLIPDTDEIDADQIKKQLTELE